MPKLSYTTTLFSFYFKISITVSIKCFRSEDISSDLSSEIVFVTPSPFLFIVYSTSTLDLSFLSAAL